MTQMKKNFEYLYEFGERLKSLRIKHEYTQRYVAHVLNITYQSYQAYEIGKTLPTTINLIKLADLFEISIDNLIGREV